MADRSEAEAPTPSSGTLSNRELLRLKGDEMKKIVYYILPIIIAVFVLYMVKRQSSKEISVDLGEGVKMQIVLIPAGEFLMGSPSTEKERGSDEGPQHKVRITKPFYIGKYEVTQEQWEAVMGNNPSRFKGAKNPVENVSWNDCQKFINKLNSIVPDGGFRLPTEAEWEYAARAGTATRFYWGDDTNYRKIDRYAWYNKNSGGRTHPVGTKKSNSFGLYDISGNVWEWCSDPKGPDSDNSRILRGGSWGGNGGLCRSANRIWNSPSYWYIIIGFRCARAP